MHKRYWALALLVTIFMMGCGKEPVVSTMTIHKDGVVESYIVEEFMAPQYDANELKNSVLEEIATVNEAYENPIIELKEFEVIEGVLKASIEYQDASVYEEFNEETLYVGLWEDAKSLGYPVNAELENDEYKVVVFSEPVDVSVPKSIVYVSEGLEKTGKKTVTVLDKEKEIYYIIYE